MRRHLGTALVVAGALLLAYSATVLFWRDPITDLYQRYRQHELEATLDREFAAYRKTLAAPTATAGEAEPSLAAQRKAVAAAARRFRETIERGDPLGRLVVPKLDLRTVVVNGTRWGPDLSQGPGRYEKTELPGLASTTGIAGHRTTFGAPFRHIDSLTRGDRITLELPYATFHYRVVAHEIVADDDWSVIRDRGFDTLMLSACHPLYSASQRWIVYSRLVRVERAEGGTYTL